MGQSTDAILCYGMQIEQDSDLHEMVDYLYDEHWSAVSKARVELGVNIISHCSADYPMYIIGIEHGTARRGHPIEFETLPVAGEMDKQKIFMFCQRFNIPFEAAKVKWILTSDWS